MFSGGTVDFLALIGSGGSRGTTGGANTRTADDEKPASSRAGLFLTRETAQISQDVESEPIAVNFVFVGKGYDIVRTGMPMPENQARSPKTDV